MPLHTPITYDTARNIPLAPYTDNENLPEWLVELSYITSVGGDTPKLIEIVRAESKLQAARMAFETRNIQANWIVTDVVEG